MVGASKRDAILGTETIEIYAWGTEDEAPLEAGARAELFAKLAGRAQVGHLLGFDARAGLMAQGKRAGVRRYWGFSAPYYLTYGSAPAAAKLTDAGWVVCPEGVTAQPRGEEAKAAGLKKVPWFRSVAQYLGEEEKTVAEAVFDAEKRQLEARMRFLEKQLQMVSQKAHQVTANQLISKSSLLDLLLTVVCGCTLLALFVAESASARWAICGILAGLAAGTFFIYDAQATKRKLLPKVGLYLVGFVLLTEVVLFIDSLVLKMSR